MLCAMCLCLFASELAKNSSFWVKACQQWGIPLIDVFLLDIAPEEPACSWVELKGGQIQGQQQTESRMGKGLMGWPEAYSWMPH